MEVKMMEMAVGIVEAVVNYMQNITTVTQVFLLGYSNGCALTQQVLIQSKLPIIKGGICLNSQLTHSQYHNHMYKVSTVGQ